MGKLISWVVIIAVGYLAYRLLVVLQRKALAARTGQSPKAPSADSPSAPAPRELMRRCDLCGTHVPGSDALVARGRYYCSAAHRDQAG